jgi:hypothetical protein
MRENTILFIKPLKMDLTEGSETSAKPNLTPGENPKENTQDSEHGETLKSRKHQFSAFLHLLYGSKAAYFLVAADPI